MRSLTTTGRVLVFHAALLAIGCSSHQALAPGGDAGPLHLDGGAGDADTGDSQTTDGGDSSAPKMSLGMVDGLHGANVVSIVVDPSDSDRIFVNTGFGVWLSEDAAGSWTEISDGIPTPGQFVWKVIVDPHGDRQYAAMVVGTTTGCKGIATQGLLRRIGNGRWEPIVDGFVPGVRTTMCGATDVITDSHSPGRLFAASPKGVFRSTDGGDHWERVLTLVDPTVGLVRVALDPADSNRVFAVRDDQVWRSVDGGDNWEVTPVGHLEAHSSYSLAVDPADGDHVVAGTWGQGVIESIDGGRTFGRAGLHPAGFYIGNLVDYGPQAQSGWISGLVFRPGRGDLVASHYWSRSLRRRGPSLQQPSWSKLGSELPAALVISMAVDPNDESTLYAGIDGLGVYRSTDNAKSWERVTNNLGHGGAREIATAPGGFRYTTSDNGVFASEDGGRTWRDTNHQLRGYPQWNIAVAPDDPRVTFVATREAGISRSDDAGRTFRPINNGLVSFEASMDSDYVEPPVALRPLGDGSTVLATMHFSGLWRTDNGGASWRQLYTNQEGTVVGQLTVDPSDPDSVLFSTARAGGRVRLVRSMGQSWVSSDSGLPTIPIASSFVAWLSAYWTVLERTAASELVLAPVFVAEGTTDPVLYCSTDDGMTWHGCDKGLPHPAAAPGFFPGVRPAVGAIAFAHDGDGPWVASIFVDSKLYISHDRGTSWQPLEVTPSLGAMTVDFLALDPDQPDLLWVATGDHGVFRVRMKLDPAPNPGA